MEKNTDWKNNEEEKDKGFDLFGYSYHRALTYTLYIYSTKEQSTGLLILIRPMIDRPVFALKVKKNWTLFIYFYYIVDKQTSKYKRQWCNTQKVDTGKQK